MGVGEAMAREEMGTPEVEGEIFLFALPFLTLFARYGPMEDGVNVGGTDGGDGGDH